MSRLASGFNLTQFKELFAKRENERADLVFMAQKAEAAERYDDMCKFMRELVELSDKTSEPLNVEERNLLSVAYKNVIGARRATFRGLAWEAENQQGNANLIEEYKRQVEKELSDICTDILDLLENILGKNSTDKDEARVFYLKMTGDYYRYLAESVDGKGYEKKTESFYTEAFDIAKDELPPTHPIRLGLALNYSVCLFEILKKKEKACDLAKNAFDEAIKGLDQVEEADYKDSTLIMQLLRDNLNLWTSSGDEGEEGIAVQDLSDEDS